MSWVFYRYYPGIPYLTNDLPLITSAGGWRRLGKQIKSQDLLLILWPVHLIAFLHSFLEEDVPSPLSFITFHSPRSSS